METFHKEIMKYGLLRDLGNDEIVWCDSNMERALNQRVVHLSQFKRMIMSNLERSSEREVTLPLSMLTPEPMVQPALLIPIRGPTPEASRQETERIMDRATAPNTPAGYVRVTEEEDGKALDLPTEEDGQMLLTALRSRIPGACGLQFRNPATRQWQAVRLAEGRLCLPGQGQGTFVAVMEQEEQSGLSGSVSGRQHMMGPAPIFTMYTFNANAPLKVYLVNKTCSIRRYYSMQTILQVIKDVCIGEKLCDPRNPNMVTCPPDLEQALNRKVFHTSDCHDLILQQVTRLEDQTLRDTPTQVQGEGMKPVPETPQRVTRRVSLELWNMIHKSPWTARFTLKPHFLAVAAKVRGTITEHTSLPYREVVRILADYLEQKKHDLYDSREPKVAIVKDDILGEAFEVDAFHHRQAETLLLTQLLPIRTQVATPAASGSTNVLTEGRTLEPWFEVGSTGDTLSAAAEGMWQGKQWRMKDPDPTILKRVPGTHTMPCTNMQSPTHGALIHTAWEEIAKSDKITLNLNINSIGILVADHGKYFQEVVPPIGSERVFCLRYHFRKLLQPYLPNREVSKMYHYEEINRALLEYIQAKNLWDMRNPEIAVVNRDPLGPIIGMGAMLRGTDVIRAQLEPVNATGQGWRLFTENWVATHQWGGVCPMPPPPGFTWQRVRGQMDFQRQIEAGKLLPSGHIWMMQLNLTMGDELPTRWELDKPQGYRTDLGVAQPGGIPASQFSAQILEELLLQREGQEEGTASDASTAYEQPDSDSDTNPQRFPGEEDGEDTDSDPQATGLIPTVQPNNEESEWADDEELNNQTHTDPCTLSLKCQMCNQESKAVTHCNSCWKRKKSMEPPHLGSKQRRMTQSYKTPEPEAEEHGTCILCCAREADTGFVHGRTTHMFSCYHCARNHWKMSNRCPVCNRQIEKIVKIIAS